MKMNPLQSIDFYKTGHHVQYPEGTTEVYSNFTARSSKLFNSTKGYDNTVTFFGLQYFIKDFLIDSWNENFFNRPKKEVIQEYKKRMDTSLGANAVDTKHIEELHDLGFLPIRIKALAEGIKVPIGVPLLTIVNTLPDFFWLTNYLETALSCYLWKPITSATIASEYRRILTEYAEKTGTPLDFVKFQAHDFSFRGMSSLSDAAISGAAHLTSFVGTDTVLSIDLLEKYYNADATKELIGCSVPATEHSVMCMGSKDGELSTFKRLITETYPEGIVSIVSDTWDFWQVITDYLVELKPQIVERNGKVVIRPDSGDPVKILCGEVIPVEIPEEYYTSDFGEQFCADWIFDSIDEPHGEYGDVEYSMIFKNGETHYKCTIEVMWGRYDKRFYYLDDYKVKEFVEYTMTPQDKGAVECLWEIFGGTITKTGHKLLDSHIGLIYGDSITLQRADEILKILEKKGFASGNVVFGVGSYTYQYLTRDTFGFAVKATSGVVNGERRDIFKNPKTDSGTKKSAKGLLQVAYNNSGLVLLDQQSEEDEKRGLLETVFENGKHIKEYSISQIRDNATAKI